MQPSRLAQLKQDQLSSRAFASLKEWRLAEGSYPTLPIGFAAQGVNMFFARVMSTNLKRQTIDEAVAEWRTNIEPFKANGMSKAYMFVDRNTGKYLSITIWQSEDALERNSMSAGQTK